MSPSRNPGRTRARPTNASADLLRVDAVLRALRGEDMAGLANDLGVSVEEIAAWRDNFLAAGVHQLDSDGTRSDGARRQRREPGEARRVESPKPKGWRQAASTRTIVGLQPQDEAVGLRERKKAKTRAAIREHAMRLFAEQGYYATTVNQIAEAAEVSPSTFFRYFSTKEDVVFADNSDAELIEHFHAQPPDLPPVQAVFQALLSGMASTASEEAVREQILLCLTVPELRSALFDNMTQLMARIGELVAERVGRDPDDLAVKTFAAALQGVWMSVLFDWAENGEVDLNESMAEAMSLVEAGLPL